MGNLAERQTVVVRPGFLEPAKSSWAHCPHPCWQASPYPPISLVYPSLACVTSRKLDMCQLYASVKVHSVPVLNMMPEISSYLNFGLNFKTLIVFSVQRSVQNSGWLLEMAGCDTFSPFL